MIGTVQLNKLMCSELGDGGSLVIRYKTGKSPLSSMAEHFINKVISFGVSFALRMLLSG